MYFTPMVHYAFFNVLYTLCNLLLVIYKLIFDRINLSVCLSVCLSERTNEWKTYTTQFEIQQCSNLKTIVYAFNM
jgi:hypothetical protein